MQAGQDTSVTGTKLAGDLGAPQGAVYKIKYDMSHNASRAWTPTTAPRSATSEHSASTTPLLLGSINKGNQTAELADMMLANSELTTAEGKLQAATSDIDALNTSQSS